MTGLRITKLQHDGYWTARVSSNGQTIPVDRRYGSWEADIKGKGRCIVLPHIAAELQRKVRREERRRG